MRYKENAPVESILSRDNYSTSAHPSMLNDPPKTVKASATDEDQMGNQPTSHSRVKKYFNKTGGSKNPTTGRESEVSGTGVPAAAVKKPRDIMNQNAVRQDAQYASAKAGSILSNSANGDGDEDKTDVNERTSSLEQGTEGEGSGIHKDPSSYNITPADIAAIP